MSQFEDAVVAGTQVDVVRRPKPEPEPEYVPVCTTYPVLDNNGDVTTVTVCL